MVIVEWITAKSDGLFDESQNITLKRIILYLNK